MKLSLRINHAGRPRDRIVPLTKPAPKPEKPKRERPGRKVRR